MKVKKLIKILEKMDQELEVFIDWDANGPASIIEVTLENTPNDYPEDWNMPNKWVEIIG